MSIKIIASILLLSISLFSCSPDAQKKESKVSHVDSKTDCTKTKQAIPQSPKTDSSAAVYGIDISKYQGNILSEIDSLSHLDFIICKATEGINYVDPDFQRNWKGIKNKNIVRGAYHFYRTNDDPLQQAQFFVKTVGALDILDLPLVMDIEEGSLVGKIDTKILQQHLLVFLKEVETRTHKKPILYTGLSFANRYLLSPSFASYDLWLAEYNGKDKPTLPSTWKTKGYLIWQKMDNYSLKNEQTDYDVFTGDKGSFFRYIKGSTK